VIASRRRRAVQNMVLAHVPLARARAHTHREEERESQKEGVRRSERGRKA